MCRARYPEKYFAVEVLERFKVLYKEIISKLVTMIKTDVPLLREEQRIALQRAQPNDEVEARRLKWELDYYEHLWNVVAYILPQVNQID